MNNIVRIITGRALQAAALAVAALLGVSCNQNVAQKPAGVQVKGDTVFVSQDASVHAKLKTDRVTARDYSFTFTTTGIVKPIPGQLAEIAPPFEGRITRACVQLGQKVRAGTPVFEMHSADFNSATKEYFQALQAKKVKEAQVKRQRALVENGVGVVKELEEAEMDFRVAVTELEQATAYLQLFHTNPETLAMGQPLQVVSPIAGEVVEHRVVTGQYVKDSEEPLIIVAELDRVRVVADVKEKYINSISPDDRVEIHTQSNPDKVFTGTISYVGKLLDEETRSAQVFITCDNKEGLLRPGMFAGVRFINEPKSSVLIPSTAVLQGEESAYVLVQQGEGLFVRRNVQVVTANADTPDKTAASFVLITEGLVPDEVIVTEGGIYLMTEGA